MKKAFIFPGQGSQFVGMGKDVADAFPEARLVFEEVDEALKQRLSSIIFNGPQEDLTLTENTQPALMAVSLAIVRVMEKQSRKPLSELCSYVAGHSLGEYTALAAAGAISLTDTARLLRTRGQAMQQAVPAGKGGMAALIGADIETAAKLAERAAEQEICQVANDNGGGQIVISGHNGAIDRAVALAGEFGIKRAVKLTVSAPFHCELMKPAADVMQRALEETTVNAPAVPLLANVTAEEVVDPATIRSLLVQQVTGRVRWSESVLRLKEKSVVSLTEIGAGKVLAGLVKRIDKDLEATSIQTPQDIEAFFANA